MGRGSAEYACTLIGAAGVPLAFLAPAPAEEAPKSEPWKLYAGADYVKTWVSSTGAGNLGVQDYHGSLLSLSTRARIRAASLSEKIPKLALAASRTR